eukprot:1548871-Rhodomonas_salina.2
MGQTGMNVNNGSTTAASAIGTGNKEEKNLKLRKGRNSQRSLSYDHAHLYGDGASTTESSMSSIRSGASMLVL